MCALVIVELTAFIRYELKIYIHLWFGYEI